MEEQTNPESSRRLGRRSSPRQTRTDARSSRTSWRWRCEPQWPTHWFLQRGKLRRRGQSNRAFHRRTARLRANRPGPHPTPQSLRDSRRSHGQSRCRSGRPRTRRRSPWQTSPRQRHWDRPPQTCGANRCSSCWEPPCCRRRRRIQTLRVPPANRSRRSCRRSNTARAETWE